MIRLAGTIMIKQFMGLAILTAQCAMGLEIVGHRGACNDAPENTLSSFKLGYQQKADADELDIYLTADGKVVVMHDPNTLRTSGVSMGIAQSTFEQLRTLDIGQTGPWAGKGFSEKIPALEEVLALIPEGKRLFIEIKCGPEVLPELEKVLQRAGKKPGQTALIGFDYTTMAQAKKRFPHLQTYWLVGKAKTGPSVDELINQAKAANLDGLDLQSAFPIDRDFAARVHSAGLKLYTWTVDDAAVARAEAQAGVDGVTTDRPGWLREQLAALEKK